MERALLFQVCQPQFSMHAAAPQKKADAKYKKKAGELGPRSGRTLGTDAVAAARWPLSQLLPAGSRGKSGLNQV
jgi:hypothetical protein